MRLIIYILFCLGFSSSCTRKHYPVSTYNSVFEFMNEMDKLNIDTTFSYNLVDSLGKSFTPINLMLPDNLGGQKIRGMIKLYSLLDKHKKVTEIEFFSVELYKKQKPFFYFNNEKYNQTAATDYYRKLKIFLMSAIKDYPVKTNRTPIKDVHKTYCLVMIP